MKTIQLTQGKTAHVSDEDYEEFIKHKWYAVKHRKTYYAAHNVRGVDGKCRKRYMHRAIINTPEGMFTDHRDGNGLNNQRNNLRVCTTSENGMNQGMNSRNTSGFKGVYWNKQNKKWIAQIKVNRKRTHLGYFNTKEEAYDTYCKACKKYHGEFANY